MKRLLNGFVLASSLIGAAAQAHDFHADVLAANINVSGLSGGNHTAETSRYYLSSLAAEDIPTHIFMRSECNAADNQMALTGVQFRDVNDNTILDVSGCERDYRTVGGGGVPRVSHLNSEKLLPIPFGTDSIVVYADRDRQHDDGNPNFANVSVNILGEDVPVPTNTKPVANKDNGISTTSGNSVTVFPLLNDTDPDGDVLSITKTWKVDYGNSVVINSDGSVTFTAGVNYVGSDYFYYEISDGNGGTDTGSITVQVNP